MKLKDIKTYYINLDEDIDRNLKIKQFLDDNHFSNYERFSGIRGKHFSKDLSSIVGCAMSHLSILKNAPEDVFLILEDDALPTTWFDPNYEINLDNIDALYLGISMWAREDPSVFTESQKFKELPEVNRHLYYNYINHQKFIKNYSKSGPYLVVNQLQNDTRKIENMLATHAILYSSYDFKQRAIQLIEDNLKREIPVHFDCLYADILQKEYNVYCLDKPPFYQSSSAGVTLFDMDKYEEEVRKHFLGY